MNNQPRNGNQLGNSGGSQNGEQLGRGFIRNIQNNSSNHVVRPLSSFSSPLASSNPSTSSNIISNITSINTKTTSNMPNSSLQQTNSTEQKTLPTPSVVQNPSNSNGIPKPPSTFSSPPNNNLAPPPPKSNGLTSPLNSNNNTSVSSSSSSSISSSTSNPPIKQNGLTSPPNSNNTIPRSNYIPKNVSPPFNNTTSGTANPLSALNANNTSFKTNTSSSTNNGMTSPPSNSIPTPIPSPSTNNSPTKPPNPNGTKSTIPPSNYVPKVITTNLNNTISKTSSSSNLPTSPVKPPPTEKHETLLQPTLDGKLSSPNKPAAKLSFSSPSKTTPKANNFNSKSTSSPKIVISPYFPSNKSVAKQTTMEGFFQQNKVAPLPPPKKVQIHEDTPEQIEEFFEEDPTLRSDYPIEIEDDHSSLINSTARKRKLEDDIEEEHQIVPRTLFGKKEEKLEEKKNAAPVASPLKTSKFFNKSSNSSQSNSPLKLFSSSSKNNLKSSTEDVTMTDANEDKMEVDNTPKKEELKTPKKNSVSSKLGLFSSPLKTPNGKNNQKKSNHNEEDEYEETIEDEDYDETEEVSTPSKITKGSSIPFTSSEKVQAEKKEMRFHWLEFPRDAHKRTKEDPNYDPSTLYIPEDAWSKLTASKQQYWKYKKDLYDTILFFQQGAFYNVFETDADILHTKLGFAYTGGENRPVNNYYSGCNAGEVFKNMAALMDMGYRVAKIDQAHTAKTGDKTKKKNENGTEDRKMDRIFTPGTVTDENYLPSDSVFVLVLSESDDKKMIGFCLVDASVGQFNLGLVGEREPMIPADRFKFHLETLLIQTKPKEVIVDKKMDQETVRFVKRMLPLASVRSITFDHKEDVVSELVRSKRLGTEEEFPEPVKQYLNGEKYNDAVIHALGGCRVYFKQLNIDERMMTQRNFVDYSKFGEGKSLVMGGQVLKNLEILENNRGELKGTLLNFLNQCLSPFGSRMMRKWVCYPLRIPQEIEERLDAVNEMMNCPELQAILLSELTQLPDIERKLSALKNMRRSSALFLTIINAFQSIFKLVKLLRNQFRDRKIRSSLLHKLVTPEGMSLPASADLKHAGNQSTGQFPDVDEEWAFFDNAIDKSSTTNLAVKRGYLPEYDQAQATLDQIKEEMDQYLEGFVAKYCGKVKGCAKWSQDAKLGICIEVNKKNIKGDLSSKFHKDTPMKDNKTCFKVVPLDLNEILERKEEEEESANAISMNLVFTLSDRFLNHINLWQNVISVVSSLDCIYSLSKVSTGMCRPIIERGNQPLLHISQMVHPCINYGENGAVPNDVNMGKTSAPIVLLTGPNMGGKSTLLRSTCVIVILAQIGCFVPAQECRMTPVDRIFTRIGANDQIMQNQSTFMMELNETEVILRHATPNSLVILDELGRGTSTFDGYSLAFGVLDHFSKNLPLRLLFATHYHLLTEEFGSTKNVSVNQMSTVEYDGKLVFTYQMLPGVCPKSYGMNVARMAGISEDVIKRAEVVAIELEGKSNMSLSKRGGMRENRKALLRHLIRSSNPSQEEFSKIVNLWSRIRLTSSEQ
eukprot:TRINITY_DN6438_c0_g1_i1.p1 TRINITY_DN6438_c0_g1~~TRINITY_DN6438_c0_g1_i1.p1  ORF type:complete len:1543 (-),score=515.42 TRINITY_DN6438_c0_g1_i1:107-4735(-)